MLAPITIREPKRRPLLYIALGAGLGWLLVWWLWP